MVRDEPPVQRRHRYACLCHDDHSVSTDPIVATYPILVMPGGRVLMRERLGAAQYALLLGIVSGSILIVAGTI
jgi:drug/metabolite transporter (DMT)-like permease